MSGIINAISKTSWRFTGQSINQMVGCGANREDTQSEDVFLIRSCKRRRAVLVAYMAQFVSANHIGSTNPPGNLVCWINVSA